MTVASTLDKNFYTANGSQTDFAYGFKIYNANEMRVVTRDDGTGVETVENPNDYTVTGVGLDNGGTVAFDTAPTEDHIVLLRRYTSLLQNTDIRNQESYRPAEIETGLDTLLFQIQRIQYDADRSIKLMESEAATAALTVLPPLAERKGKVLGFNETTGNPVAAIALVATENHASTHQDGGGDKVNVAGLSGELADNQPPKGHEGSHRSGAGDALRIDNLQEGEDNTDTDSSTGRHGLMKKYPGGTTNYLREDGNFTDPSVSPATVSNGIFQARITLVSGNPVPTTDQVDKDTLYLTPHGGEKITIYTGSQWDLFTLTEISSAVPGTTNQMYDVFVYDSTGPALDFVAWTNDTTRATALVKQDGVWVKSGQVTRRYVGSFRTSGVNGKTEDSLVKRYVWNYYNRVRKVMSRVDVGSGWNYTTAAWRQANGSAANQLDFIVGVSEDLVIAEVLAHAYNDTGQVGVGAGIGIRSTTINSANIHSGADTQTTLKRVSCRAAYRAYPSIGRTYLVWLEWSYTGGTTGWTGSNSTTVQSGISGEVWG